MEVRPDLVGTPRMSENCAFRRANVLANHIYTPVTSSAFEHRPRARGMLAVHSTGGQRELWLPSQGDEEAPRRTQLGGQRLALRDHHTEQSVQQEDKRRRQGVRVA